MADTEQSCYLPCNKSKEITKLERKAQRGFEYIYDVVKHNCEIKFC